MTLPWIPAWNTASQLSVGCEGWHHLLHRGRGYRLYGYKIPCRRHLPLPQGSATSGTSDVGIQSIGGNLHLNGTFLPCYDVKASSSSTTAGTVQVSPAPNCLGTKYVDGTPVSLQAIPKPTYGFSRWTDLTTNNPVDYSVNPFTYDVSSNRILSANFVLIPAPVQVSLPGGAFTTDSTPELSWNPVSGGVTYQVQISFLATFSSLIQDLTSGGTFVIADPLPDGKYFWRVRAKNADSYPGIWSAVRYFTVDTAAPPAPVLKSPIDNYFAIGTPPFSWNASAGAKWYKLGVTTGGDCSLSDPDAFPLLMSTSYTPPTLEPGEWKWCVKAGDASGELVGLERFPDGGYIVQRCRLRPRWFCQPRRGSPTTRCHY